jgi:predicted ATPase
VETAYDELVQSTRNSISEDLIQRRLCRRLDVLHADLRKMDERLGESWMMGNSINIDERLFFCRIHSIITRARPLRFDIIAWAKRYMAFGLQRLYLQWLTPSSAQQLQPRGVYIHGSVGVGKSFCMDLFYEHYSQCDDESMIQGGCRSGSRRLHFHEFMLDVHQPLTCH